MNVSCSTPSFTETRWWCVQQQQRWQRRCVEWLQGWVVWCIHWLARGLECGLGTNCRLLSALPSPSFLPSHSICCSLRAIRAVLEKPIWSFWSFCEKSDKISVGVLSFSLSLSLRPILYTHTTPPNPSFFWGGGGGEWGGGSFLFFFPLSSLTVLYNISIDCFCFLFRY